MQEIQFSCLGPLHNPTSHADGFPVRARFRGAFLTRVFDGKMSIESLSPRVEAKGFNFGQFFQSSGFQTIRSLGHRANFSKKWKTAVFRGP
jgi:hypothetical protein